MKQPTFQEVAEELIKKGKLYDGCNDMYYIALEENVSKGITAISKDELHDTIFRTYYEMTKDFPNKTMETKIIEYLKMKARNEGEKHELLQRVGLYKDRLYYDLGKGKYVVFRKKGPKIVRNMFLPFRRRGSFQDQPKPNLKSTEKGWNQLRDLLNVSDEDFKLIQYWLVSAFLMEGERPVLIVVGPQGSGKSSMLKMLKMLVDPYKNWDLTGLPSEPDDMIISASHHRISLFDNISRLSEEMSNALCRVATGTALTKRKLYSDSEEVVIRAKSLTAMNGITDFAHTSDLIDRAVVINTQPIGDKKRKMRGDIDRKFNENLPNILGAILNSAYLGNQYKDIIELEEVPRMADATIYAAAWYFGIYNDEGDMIDAIMDNRHKLKQLPLEADIFASYFMKFIEQQDYCEIKGLAQEIYESFMSFMGDKANKSFIPTSAKSFGSRLMKQYEAFKAVGVTITKERVSKGTYYQITYQEPDEE